MIDKYNKLVRDRIPEIISAQGDIPHVKTIDDKTYFEELNRKLKEEMNEYLQDYDIHELADIVEVILALVKHSNISFEEFEQIRMKKHNQNGGFDKKVFLVEVHRKNKQ